MTDIDVIEIMLDGSIEQLGMTLGAAYAALAPAGLVVVLKEPTNEDVEAVAFALKDSQERVRRIYKAMVERAAK